MPDYGLYGRTLSRRFSTVGGIALAGLGYGGIKKSAQIAKDYLPKIGKQLVKLATAKELAKIQPKSITTRKPTSLYNIDETNKFSKFYEPNKFSKFYEPNIPRKSKPEQISDTVFDNQMKERLKALQKETKPSQFIPYNVQEVPKPPPLQSKRTRLYNKLKLRNEKKVSSSVKNTMIDIKSKAKQNIIQKEINQGIDIIEQNIKDSTTNFSKINMVLGGVATGGLSEISGALSYDSLIKPKLYEDLERF